MCHLRLRRSSLVSVQPSSVCGRGRNKGWNLMIDHLQSCMYCNGSSGPLVFSTPEPLWPAQAPVRKKAAKPTIDSSWFNFWSRRSETKTSSWQGVHIANSGYSSITGLPPASASGRNLRVSKAQIGRRLRISLAFDRLVLRLFEIHSPATFPLCARYCAIKANSEA